jgi:hypothetical protein
MRVRREETEDWGTSGGSSGPQREPNHPINDEPDDWGSSEEGASSPERRPASQPG